MADIDFLRVHAEGSPERPALILGERVVDFATLSGRADRAAHVFTDLGCEPRDRIAIMSFNSISGSEIANGARRSRAVVVPVNYRLRGSEVAYVLNDSGARVVCADADHVDVVDAARPELKGERHYIATGSKVPDGWTSYEDLMRAASESPVEGDGSGGLGASMIYTSGTTGHPKGAWRPNGVNIENVLQVISIFELDHRDVHLWCGRDTTAAWRSSSRCTRCSARPTSSSRNSKPTARSTSSSVTGSRQRSSRRRCCSALSMPSSNSRVTSRRCAR